MSRTRDKRIRKAQSYKQQHFLLERETRELQLQDKQQRFDFRMRKTEIAEVSMNWFTAYTFVALAKLAKYHLDLKVAIRVRSAHFLKVLRATSICVTRILTLKRRLRVRRSLRIISLVLPFLGKCLRVRRRGMLGRVVHSVEHALTESTLKNLLARWVEAVPSTQVVRIQRSVRRYLSDLRHANFQIVLKWTQCSPPVPDRTKFAFVSLYRRCLRKEQRTAAPGRAKLEKAFQREVEANSFNTKTAVELIYAQTDIPKVSTSFFAVPSVTKLSDRQIEEMVARYWECVDQTEKTQDSVTMEELGEALSRLMSRKRSSSVVSRSPHGRSRKKHSPRKG